MSLDESEMQFIGSLYHAHMYALLHSMMKLLGPSQSVFMDDYAKSTQEILAKAGGDNAKILDSLKSFEEIGKERKLFRDLRTEMPDGNRVKLIVDGCSTAQMVHAPLNVTGSRVFLCPLATMAMIALANECGFKKGGNLFDCVKFDRDLSYLTQDGSETTLVIAKK